MVKKKRVQQRHISHNQTHILLKKGMAVYVIIVFFGFVLISLSIYALSHTLSTYQDAKRTVRINNVIDSLHIPNGYYVDAQNIFGEKREFEPGRTEASRISGGHDDTPVNTYKELTDNIVAAGFKPAGSAFENSPTEERFFQNEDGVWIRLNVQSAKYRDRGLYGVRKGEPLTDEDTTTAPSYFTLWVNLDDNNE